jgi:hypothetical protein
MLLEMINLMTINIEHEVSKKKIIIGMFMILGISLAALFLLPFPFNLPVYLIISIIVLATYWNRSKRTITLLLLVLLGIDLVIAFLIPYPFSLIPEFIIGYFIINKWLNSNKKR